MRSFIIYIFSALVLAGYFYLVRFSGLELANVTVLVISICVGCLLVSLLRFTKSGENAANAVKDSMLELKSVSWPSVAESKSMLMVVSVFVFIASFLLYLTDLTINYVIKSVL